MLVVSKENLLQSAVQLLSFFYHLQFAGGNYEGNCYRKSKVCGNYSQKDVRYKKRETATDIRDTYCIVKIHNKNISKVCIIHELCAPFHFL